MNILSKQNKSILREMITTSFKIRYQESILGYAWSLLRPLFMFTILYLIFTYVFKVSRGVPHYTVYLLLGIVLWNYMAETTQQGVSAIVGSGNLLNKVNIPKYLPVFSTSLSAFVNLFLNLIVVFIFILFNGIIPTINWLLFPLFIIELFVFSIAISFALSALYVKYRDINFVWELVLQAGFYATPIIYPISLIPQKFVKLFMLNPMAQIIQDSRFSLIVSTKSTVSVSGVFFYILPIALVSIILLLSVLYFKKSSRDFVENI